MIFDSHTHLNLAAFDKDLEEVIKRNLNENVFIIDVGTCLETSKKAIAIAKQNNNCWATVGLHPSHTIPMKIDKNELILTDSQSDFLNSETFNESFEVLFKEPKVVAVGECGLDYTYLRDFSIRNQIKYQEVEKNEFRKQIRAAKKYQLPLNLHVRNLYEEALSVLKDEGYKGKAVFHFFTGNRNQAKAIMEKGFHLGFSGIITYSSGMDAVIREIPLKKILIETDAPYVAPEPYRGKRNEPIYVKKVAKKIAAIKKLPPKEIEKATFQNTRELFNI